jgi:processing peptidase subunit alpha
VVARLTRAGLLAYHQQHVTGGRVVLAGVGVSHGDLVRHAQRHFAHIPAGPAPAADGRYRFPAAAYTGGHVAVPQWEAPPDTPDVKHVAIGFPAPSWHDPKLYTACVLQQLLGGGSSFSAGGPGKGMYSRMYTRVLAANGDFESAQGLFTAFEDTGLFAVQGSATAAAMPELVGYLVNQMRDLLKFYVSPAELLRAKNMLKSLLMMNLEHRAVALEDLGRQVLTYGQRELPHITCAKVDAVTQYDVAAMVKDMINQPLTLATLGTAPRMPTPQRIREMLFAP